MSDVKVSVIVPVWNPGEGIGDCLESLCGQTLADIEMIFVDDLGTDGAMERVERAAAGDPRIRIVRNDVNRGQGYSRNVGIGLARGEYLSFIDPDDHVAPDYYELLYGRAHEEGLDIVKGRIRYLREDGTPSPHHEQNEAIRKGLASGRSLYALFTYEHHSALYRRELVVGHDVRYGLARRAQDTTFLLRVCHAAESFDLVDDACYYFCEREGSAMHTFDASSLAERLLSFGEQVDYLVEALADDPEAVGYTRGIFLTSLRFYACYEPLIDDEGLLGEYACGMREQLLRLPYARELAEGCFPAKALMETGCLLPMTPGILPWETATSREWAELLDRWCAFLAEHELLASRGAPSVRQIVDQARSCGHTEGREREVDVEITRSLARLDARTHRIVLRQKGSPLALLGRVRAVALLRVRRLLRSNGGTRETR